MGQSEINHDQQPDLMDGIAIIGMSCHFPGARNVEKYWKNLCEGQESITTFSDEELKAAGVSVSDLNNPNYVKAKPVLEDIELFDAQFFKYTPREAAMIDPQHRALMECAWEALESSGYDPATVNGRIGVYAGADMNTYLLRNLVNNPDVLASEGTILFLTGNDKDYLSTRISYKFNLRGPSFTVQSACSTSLVAIHLASEALMIGECDMALAGGACISVPHRVGYLYEPGSVESPDGHCRSFDAKANGTVFGSGVGVVVLKRLSDAVANGDTVYAVIKGSATNNDGALRAGYTAPGVHGQAAVITEALSVAGINPETISYVETHGTGTELGDPIEIDALTQAYRLQTNKKGYCAIGSVKTNFGHLSTASGVAAIIKTSLALKHKLIPPSLHYQSPNPKIDFANSPFFVNPTLRPWENPGRRAAVSGFGIGGTNVHIIMEEAPVMEPSGRPLRNYQLLTLSAHTQTALDTMTQNLGNYFTEHPDLNPADAAYTLHIGRQAFENRRVVIANSLDSAAMALQSLNPAEVLTSDTPVKDKKQVVFMFSGQGSQHIQMGRELYGQEQIFRQQVDRCAEYLQQYLGFDIRTVIYPAPDQIEKANEMLIRTAITQPALFVIEYALAQQWIAWGIKPQAMIGHSVGEYVAACLAGVIELKDALMLVAERGRLMQSLPAGVMLSVPLSEDKLKPRLGNTLSIGVVNHPEHCVVSGQQEAVAVLEEELAKEGIEGRRLLTSHAFHSPMMEPILDQFMAKVSQVSLHEPKIPYISNVTGTWITAEETTQPLYWCRHLRQTVRFAEGISVLLQTPDYVLLEVGPGNVLKSLAQHHPKRDKNQTVLASMRHPKEETADDFVLLRTLGQLWLQGVSPDWKAFHKGEKRRRIMLPAYPFQRKRYWIEPQTKSAGMASALPGQLSKNPDVTSWFYIPSWKHTQPPVRSSQALEGKWLLFSDDSSFSKTLSRRIQNCGGAVFMVRMGDGFLAEGDSFRINPSNRNDYRQLVQALESKDSAPTHIIHLWNLTPPSQENQCIHKELLDLSFYSLMFLAQELESIALKQNIQIALVSNGMQKVVSNEPLHPEKATVLGISRVIQQEMPNMTVRCIDLSIPVAGSRPEAWTAEQILAEIETNQTDRIVVYRGNDRLIQIFDPAPIPDANGLEHKLREKGIYLITGGLGGIGLTLGRYLAKTIQARLVLINRSGLPEKIQWDQWLATHDPRDRTSLRIQAVKSLEDAGAEVLVIAADVTDPKQMEQAVQTASEHFGTIHGVIHSAGVQDGDWIRDKSRESVERVFAAKIYGTQVLMDVLCGMPLDFLMLFSSIMSLIAIAGQADYCAGNSFLDAFANSYHGQSETPIIAVDWDEWAEVGMGVNAALSNFTMQKPSTVKSTQPRPIEHPMIQNTYSESENKAFYEMELQPEKHWILSEHRRMGYCMVPATGYLELVRSAYADFVKNSRFVIRDVIFLSPFFVGDGDSKKAQIVLEKNATGTEFQLTGLQGIAMSGEPLRHTFATGELGSLQDTELKQYNLDHIRAQCTLAEIEFGFGTQPERAAVSNPRWKSVRKVSIGPDIFLAEIELGSEFSNDLQEYKLHPALLDLATGFFIDQQFLPYLTSGQDNTEQYYYLPMSYRNLHILGDIPAKFHSYVRIQPSDSDSLSVQVTLINEQGQGIIEIDSYTLQRMPVNIPGASSESQEQNATAQPAKDDRYYQRFKNSIFPEEGVEAFRRILAHNRLSQIVVCTKDLPRWLQDISKSKPDDIAEMLPDNGAKVTLHPRPNLETPYVAPQNRREEDLATIWQSMLGVDQVGIHDNFFELGGDSILGIQIVAKAKQIGIGLTPKDLFQKQTIAELAMIGEPMAAVKAPAPGVENHEQAENGSPLTPMQENMIYRRLNHPETGLYLWFSVFPIRKLDVPAFERAWQWVVQRHVNLRTRFVLEETHTPYQIAAAQGEISIEQEDWQNLSPDVQQKQLEDYIQSVRNQNFDLTHPTPIRLALFQVAPDDYRFVWSINYMLLDGWSYALILKELFAYYDATTQGLELNLPAVQQPHHYLAWLHEQDLTHAQEYWRKSLDGYLNRRSLLMDPSGGNRLALEPNYIQSGHRLIVSPQTTAALQTLCRQYHLTLNTLVQGAWAILLSHMSQEERVIFGVTSSGRSAEWDGIDTLAGFFVNTLPIGVEVLPEKDLVTWLKDLQNRNSEMRQYEFTPILKIKEWLDMPSQIPFPDTYLVFENFPIDSSVGVWAQRLEISETRVFVQTEHPLRVEVYPGIVLAIMFSYYQRYFSEELIASLVQGMHILLENMAAKPEQPLAEIMQSITIVSRVIR